MPRSRSNSSGVVRLTAAHPPHIRAGLVDELHLAVAPVFLGSGERLFEGVDMRALGYRRVERVSTDLATHLVLRR